MTIYHGGALDDAIKQFGGNQKNWIDCSTGINPYHYPIESIPPESWTQLPQASALERLTLAAENAYGCDPKFIMAANGTQLLIETLPQIFKKSTIAILSPTYEEHAHNWAEYGHEVIVTDDLATAKTADHLLIVNPNNPDGKIYSVTEMTNLHQYFSAKGGCLIVDEAFMDLTPNMSMAGKVGADGLIVLRSFGKFFGLAGVRVGFMLAPIKMCQKMQAKMGLWGLAGMSMELATTALNDQYWQKEMRIQLAAEMRKMQTKLINNGFKIIGSTDLFSLVSMPQKSISAHNYFDKFANHHILTRKFTNNDKILRFGLAKRAQLNDFSAKLQQVCEGVKP